MGNFGRDNRGGGRNFGRRDFDAGRGGFSGDRGGRGGFSRGGDRHEMFSAVCSECGKECQVPFRPTNGKPVYCSNCFEKINGGRSDSRRPERPDFRPQTSGFDQNKAQFDVINVKLDKILSILSPAPVVKEKVVEPAPIKDSGKSEKVKQEKAKKTVKKAASIKKK